MAGWLTYDLPGDLAARMWGGRYRGQAQRWFLARFTGEDGDIDIGAGRPPEFDAWRWMPLSDVAAQIVPFKREVYAALVTAFANRIARETVSAANEPPRASIDILNFRSTQKTAAAGLEIQRLVLMPTAWQTMSTLRSRIPGVQQDSARLP